MDDQNAFLSDFVLPERLEQFSKILEKRTRYLSVCLDNPFDLHNISAVCRNVESFGLQDLHIIDNSERRRKKFYGNVSKSSEKWLTLKKYTDNDESNAYDQFLRANESKQIIAMVPPHMSTQTFNEVELSKPTIFIFGSEREGISDKILSKADIKTTIPMTGFTESFNLSVSVGIAMFQMRLKLEELDKDLWKLSEAEKIELTNLWLKKTVKYSDAYLNRYFNTQIG